jgi:hypothetical protein
LVEPSKRRIGFGLLAALCEVATFWCQNNHPAV